MLVKFEQPENAYLPMCVTLSDICALVKVVQLEKV